jgi:hypothetical protein
MGICGLPEGPVLVIDEGIERVCTSHVPSSLFSCFTPSNRAICATRGMDIQANSRVLYKRQGKGDPHIHAIMQMQHTPITSGYSH